MALIDWASGFELNSTTAGMEWTAILTSPTIQSTTVRSGTYALQITGLTPATVTRIGVQYLASEIAANAYFSFAFRVDTYPSTINEFLKLNDVNGTGSPSVIMVIDQTGALTLKDEDGALTGTTTLSTGVWHTIELHVDTTPAGGSHVVEARVNGAAPFASSSTRNIAATNLPFFLVLGGNLNAEAQIQGNWYFDDVAIGSSGWIGEAKMISLKPNAAGDNSAWAIGAGSGSLYEQIDEVTPDDTTTYLTSRTTGEIVDVNIESPVGIGASDEIKAVLVGYRGDRSATGTVGSAAVARIKASSGGTVTEGSAETASSLAWRTNDMDTVNAWPYTLASSVQPGTANAWTQAALETAQIGMRTSTGSGDRYFNVSTMWALVVFTPSKSNFFRMM